MNGSYSTYGVFRPLKRERGVVMIVVTVGMLAILAMAGLALDSGHMLLTKTRLQNAVDAAALSAARKLQSNRDSTLTIAEQRVQATNAAEEVFVANLDVQGHEELLESWNAGDFVLVTEYSSSLNSFTESGPLPYVRARVEGVPLDTYLIQVLGMNQKFVRASAVAGPVPIAAPCDIVPIVACGCDPETDASCNDNFGYTVADSNVALGLDDLTVLKHSGGDSSCLGVGNFHALRPGDSHGAKDFETGLAGAATNICIDPKTNDVVLDTEPGNMATPTSNGVDGRFDGGWFGKGNDKTYVYPDYVSDEALTGDELIAVNNADGCTAVAATKSGNLTPEIFGYNSGADSYLSRTQACASGVGGDCIAGGQGFRRMLVLPIARCDGEDNGMSSIDVLGYRCFLLMQRGGQGNEGGEVFGQFVDVDAVGCDALGGVAPAPDDSLPTQIVLFRDVESGDS